MGVVTEVVRDKQRVVYQSDGRDLQIHGANVDAPPAQACELVCCGLVERDDLPFERWSVSSRIMNGFAACLRSRAGHVSSPPRESCGLIRRPAS